MGDMAPKFWQGEDIYPNLNTPHLLLIPPTPEFSHLPTALRLLERSKALLFSKGYWPDLTFLFWDGALLSILFCKRKLCCAKPLCYFKSTVNSRFKLQIHLHETFFSDDRFLDSLQKSFLKSNNSRFQKGKKGLS